MPQGSLLGSLLFLLFISDIGNDIGFNDVFYLIYTDDLQLYVSLPLRKLQRYVHLAEVNANIILNWASAYQLTLNHTKNKAFLIGLYYYINLLATSPSRGLTLGDTFRGFEFSLSNLGVIFYSKLNWKEQGSSTCNSILCIKQGMNYFMVRGCHRQNETEAKCRRGAL